eukprot:TRINITY_DN2940_c0_g1_i2.p1 TRINITY_DN2940_c0_g1~~TRINITY_DN2940_c0_g1_i2.p1  ORF type:complete len:298 (+),score=44.48 TRINITY_DN2940_c0_g1_i2:273-1166(+)
MPAVHSRLFDPARSDFLQYAAKPNPEQVKAETGFSSDTLQYIWDKYKHRLPTRERGQQARLMYFYFAFRYIHMYPTWAQTPVVLWTPEWVSRKGCGISATTLRRAVLQWIAALALVLDEVHWADRLDAMNHVELLPKRFTVLVDTAPVSVGDALDKEVAKLNFQPKYKDTVYKLQIGISLVGDIVLYTDDAHPLEDWELVIGDGIYQSEEQLITKHCGNELFLSEEQLRTNATISHYRQRVEQVIKVIKNHNVFRGHFRGGSRLLSAVMKLVVHTTAVELRFHPLYTDGIGPWKHDE